MKCPLILKAHWELGLLQSHEKLDCLKEECAWWFAENGVCAVLTLAQGSVYLHRALLLLQSKIPLGGKAPIKEADWR